MPGCHTINAAALIATLKHFGQCASNRRAGENVMMNLITRMQSFVRDEEAQDLIEYAMLVALIALFCVVAVTAAGGKIVAVFNAIVAAIPS
jgi:Flp pilus assembly pilin Flp